MPAMTMYSWIYTGKALESSQHNHCLRAHIEEALGKSSITTTRIRKSLVVLVRTGLPSYVNIYLLAKKFNNKILVNSAKRILKFLKVNRCSCPVKCLKLPDHSIHTVSARKLHHKVVKFALLILLQLKERGTSTEMMREVADHFTHNEQTQSFLTTKRLK